MGDRNSSRWSWSARAAMGVALLGVLSACGAGPPGREDVGLPHEAGTDGATDGPLPDTSPIDAPDAGALDGPATHDGSGDASVPLLHTASGEMTVGASGGALALPGVRLEIPPGALADDLPISATHEVYGDTADQAINVLTLSPSGQTFDAPVTVRIESPGLTAGEVLATWSHGDEVTVYNLPVENGAVVLTSAHFSVLTWVLDGTCAASELFDTVKRRLGDHSVNHLEGLCRCRSNNFGSPGQLCCQAASLTNEGCHASPEPYDCIHGYCQMPCGTVDLPACEHGPACSDPLVPRLTVRGGTCVRCGGKGEPCCEDDPATSSKETCGRDLEPSGGPSCTCECPEPCYVGESRCAELFPNQSLMVQRCIQSSACGSRWNDLLGGEAEPEDICTGKDICTQEGNRASCVNCGGENEPCCPPGTMENEQPVKSCDYSDLRCQEGWCGAAPPDCHQTPGGSAKLDDCGRCVGGTTGLEPCKYEMELLQGYTPDYSAFTAARTINDGDTLLVYNHTTEHVRLTLDGRPVKVGRFALAAQEVDFIHPVGSSDVMIDDFKIAITDAEAGRTITRTVKLTVSNAGFRAISAATLTYEAVILTYRPDGTLTRRYSDGSGESTETWSMSLAHREQYVDCANGPLQYKITGVATAPIAYGQSPSFAMIVDGGGFKSNSYHGCPENEKLH